MLNRLLEAVLESWNLLQSFLEELSYLTLEVGLASESDLLSSIGLDHHQRGLALLVASEAKAVPDDHLSDEIILSVLDHA